MEMERQQAEEKRREEAEKRRIAEEEQQRLRLEEEARSRAEMEKKEAAERRRLEEEAEAQRQQEAQRLEQEESEKRRLQEAENQRRESLPIALRLVAETPSIPSAIEVVKFLPLYQAIPQETNGDLGSNSTSMAEANGWILNVQAALILGITDLSFQECK